MRMYLRACAMCVLCPQRPEDGARASGVGITASCVLTYVGAGNWSLVFGIHSKVCRPLSCLFSPCSSHLAAVWHVSCNRWADMNIVLTRVSHGLRHVCKNISLSLQCHIAWSQCHQDLLCFTYLFSPVLQNSWQILIFSLFMLCISHNAVQLDSHSM